MEREILEQDGEEVIKMRARLEALNDEASRWSDAMEKSVDSYEYDRLLEVLREIETIEWAMAILMKRQTNA